MRAEKSDRLFDGAIAERGGVLSDDANLLDGFDDRHGTDVEQRRITRRSGDDDIVQIHPKSMGDNMFGHAEVIVGRSAAEDDVSFRRPDIACEDIDGKLLQLIRPFDFPACIWRGGFEMERGGIAFLVGGRTRDVKRRGKRRLADVRRPVVRCHRHIDGNGVKQFLAHF